MDFRTQQPQQFNNMKQSQLHDSPDDGYQRGLDAEILVEKTLIAIKGREGRFGIKHQINDVQRSEQDSEEDKQHVDIIANVEGGIQIPFQVKPSFRAAVRFAKKCRRYGHGIIQVVVVHIGDTVQSIMEQVAEKLKTAIAQILRVKNSRIWKYRQKMWKVMGRPPVTKSWKMKTRPAYVRVESSQMCAA
jgi:hypothetical protein